MEIVVGEGVCPRGGERDEEMEGREDLKGVQPTQQEDERRSQRKRRAVSTDKPPACAVKALCAPKSPQQNKSDM